MDINKLSRGDQVIAASGIALLIFSFFSWFGAKVGGVELGTGNAWDFTLTTFAVLIGIAMVVIVSLKAFGVEVPKPGNATWGQVLLIAGAVVLLFVLIKLIAGPDYSINGIDTSRKVGIFLGFIASAGLAGGGYLKFQEDKAGGGAVPPPTA